MFLQYCSLGGFTALIAASELPSDQIQGVVLINSAGQFGDQRKQNQEKDGEDPPLVKYIVQPLKNIFQRIFLGFLFWQAKQPSRIESVLKSVCRLLLNK